MELAGLFFFLIRHAVDGTPLTEEVKRALTPETLPPLYALSKHHDVAHLVGAALKKNNLLPVEDELTPKFEKQTMLALFRYERSRVTLDALCEIFSTAKVCFAPLKGSVLRDRYPEPWMRTSCDIDILVKKEELAAAEQALLAHGYRADGKGDHDVSMFSPEGVHVELHYALMSERDLPCTAPVLADVWPRLHLADEGGYRYAMSDALFWFYHLAHMAKHVINGGCGVRPFLDLYILSRTEHDAEARHSLAEQGGMVRFAAVAERLAQVFFAGLPYDEQTLALARYVLGGGTYGNMENRVALGQSKNGGKLRYLLTRIFLPYDILKFQYPILQKRRWLTPFYQVRRWGRLIFRGGLRRSTGEIRTIGQTPKEQADTASQLLKDLGL